jgi:hypothetical protein
MLSRDPIEPASEYPTVFPIDPDPPVSGLSPTRRAFNARLKLHGAVAAVRLSLQHNARAHVGLNNAPATYVASQLKLGAEASREAKRMLEEALELLRPEIPPHPGIRPGCHFLPRYPKARNQEAFHSWVRMTYYGLFKCPILPDGRMLSRIPEELAPVQTPAIKGLVVYGAYHKASKTQFYGAWTYDSSIFIGWMRIRPHLSEIDGEYAIGEVLGRPLFGAKDMELGSDRPGPIDRFEEAFGQAAEDLGVA